MEHFNEVMARIAEIKSRFRASSFPRTSGQISSSFPDILALTLNGEKTDMPVGPVRFEELIESAAVRNNIEPGLLKALVRAESGFRPDALSRAGAMGLTQLMPGTARELGVTDPFDPAQNLEAGARYLRQQIDRFGDISLALAAYNAGPGAVNKYKGIPPYLETQNYVRKVLGYAQEYGYGDE